MIIDEYFKKNQSLFIKRSSILSEKEFEGTAVFQIVVRGNFPADSTVSVHRLF